MIAAPLLAPVRPVFRAVAVTMVPAAAQYSAASWDELEGAVEQALSQRPVALQKQLLTFVRQLNLIALVLGGRSMTALSPAARERVLHRIERSPIALLRRGLWGLRTLIFLGHYTRPEVAAATGWRGDARGWAARGGAPAPDGSA